MVEHCLKNLRKRGKSHYNYYWPLRSLGKLRPLLIKSLVSTDSVPGRDLQALLFLFQSLVSTDTVSLAVISRLCYSSSSLQLALLQCLWP